MTILDAGLISSQLASDLDSKWMFLYTKKIDSSEQTNPAQWRVASKREHNKSGLYKLGKLFLANSIP